MSERIRVYQLSRELGLTSRELIDILHKEGVDVSSHMGAVDPDIAELVRQEVIAERQSRQTGSAASESAPEAVEDAAEELPAEAEEESAAGGLPEIHIKPPVVVRDLAEKLNRKPNELVAELMGLNVFATINQTLDDDIVDEICRRHQVQFVRERRKKKKPKQGAAEIEKKEEAAEKPRQKKKGTHPRPPVVAFLGHVDHGKTSLQDYIRQTHVTSSEAGNITQHIGASTVSQEGQQITFIDTPGHEAFTAMRARGAGVTDIVVLVVAADDGVMPQTIEAIHHAQAAEVPIVVAVNKVDLPGANVNKVLMELQQHSINPEDFGGDVGVVPVSAMTGEGIDALLERILLEAEMLELGCNPAAEAEGVIIDAQLERGRGPTASVLVTDGTLHCGDVIICGQKYGRVKAMMDDKGGTMQAAGPSQPVKVLGLSGVPNAGDRVTAGHSERDAKVISEERSETSRHEHLAGKRKASLEDLFRQIEEEARRDLNIVLKADVRGSIEAIRESLEGIESEKIQVNIIHSEVGEITENDVLLAAASDAVVVGFHTRVTPNIRRKAEEQNVEIRLYSVIYELIEEIKDAMRGRLEPEVREHRLGQAEVLQTFNVGRRAMVCGCVVREGIIRRGAGARVYRDNELIYNGRLESLRRFQDDAKEVSEGFECGIRLDNFDKAQPGDLIEAYEQHTLEAAL